jgi:hypothetical protein
LNLLRWTSARTIKETFDPPKDYKYPFLEPDAAPETAEVYDEAVEAHDAASPSNGAKAAKSSRKHPKAAAA